MEAYLDESGVGTTSSSEFGSGTFKKKTIRKLEYTVQLLRLRYSVVLSDLDIVFFQNPIDYLKRYKPHAHIAVQRDFWPGNLQHTLSAFVNFSELLNFFESL
jgi:hypothetical protein